MMPGSFPCSLQRIWFDKCLKSWSPILPSAKEISGFLSNSGLPNNPFDKKKYIIHHFQSSSYGSTGTARIECIECFSYTPVLYTHILTVFNKQRKLHNVKQNLCFPQEKAFIGYISSGSTNSKILYNIPNPFFNFAFLPSSPCPPQHPI